MYILPHGTQETVEAGLALGIQDRPPIARHRVVQPQLQRVGPGRRVVRESEKVNLEETVPPL